MFKTVLHWNYQRTLHTHRQTDTAFYSLGYPPNEIHCSKPFSRIPVLQSVINSGLISSLPYYKSGQCLTHSTGSVSHCAPSQIWNIIADNTFPDLWAGPDLTRDPTRKIEPMSLGRWLSLSGSLLIWIETSVSMNHNNTPLPSSLLPCLVSVIAQHIFLPVSCVCSVQSEIQWKEKLQTNLREVACSIFAQKRACVKNLFLSQSHSFSV